MLPDHHTSPVEPRKPGDGMGWVKLYRSLLDHPRFRNGDWTKLWLCLLLRATHQPRKMVFGPAAIELRPGQLITSRAKLAEMTGMHESKIERLLIILKTERQIEQQKSSTSRLLTIVNWESHQKFEQQIELRSNSGRTAVRQRADTNKNGEKGRPKRNENKNPRGGGVLKSNSGTASPESIRLIYEAYPREKRLADTPTPAETKAIKKALLTLASMDTPDPAAALLESVQGYARHARRQTSHYVKRLLNYMRDDHFVNVFPSEAEPR